MIRNDIFAKIGYEGDFSASWEDIFSDLSRSGRLDFRALAGVVEVLVDHYEQSLTQEEKSKQEREHAEDQTMAVFNPLADDFTCMYDQTEYLVRSQDHERFEKRVGEHVFKHLVDHVLNERDQAGDPVAREEVEKEVLFVDAE